VKVGCVVLACGLSALLGHAVLGSPLSSSSPGANVWLSACNLITWLMLGSGGQLSTPSATRAAKPQARRVSLGLGKLVPAGRSCQVCVQHPGQRFHLGSLLLFHNAV